ncbi:MAG: CBS domain-containing protein [Planctomycetes bacterium]|nr:CBS domain-containing protein [Planctomycetota bacterium]
MNLEIITRRPLRTLSVNDHCRRAAELMAEHHIRHLPVVDDEVPVGMVSERDLLATIGWWNHGSKHSDSAISDWAERLPVTEVMSSPLHCLPPDSSLEKAARLMLNKKIGAVALVGAGSLHGIVTETDFLHCLTVAAWQRYTVIEHMTANVFQVSPEQPIRAAWRLMREKQIRHLVVTDNKRLRGILSDRDLLAGISWDAAGPDGIRDQVRHIMTTQVATIAPEATLALAAQRMLDWKVGALPVTDCEDLAGIITETDLLTAWVQVQTA